jgi:hypothetical protein
LLLSAALVSLLRVYPALADHVGYLCYVPKLVAAMAYEGRRETMLLGRPQVDHKKNLVSMTNLMVTLRPLFSLHKNVFALVVCVHYIGWHLAQLVLKLWQQQVQELLRY